MSPCAKIARQLRELVNMLGMKRYSREFVDACRAKVDADVAAYDAEHAGMNVEASSRLETAYFNNMLLVLDYLFVHRLAAIDGKDGNPLNELRVLCDSILSNDGVMTAGAVSKASQMRFNKSIKLSPDRSVLKHKEGDQIALCEKDFVQLSNAVFGEIESRYL
jgi:hypothetical protein